jgi:hypothetical protein
MNQHLLRATAAGERAANMLSEWHYCAHAAAARGGRRRGEPVIRSSLNIIL